jgi:hypothetical protein
MDNALLGRARVDVADARGGRVRLERCQLRRRFGIFDRDAAAITVEPRSGRQIMVGNRQRQVGPAARSARRRGGSRTPAGW